jgi:excisionase family DNA binding protein
MKHEKWTREEDIDLIKTINKHLTPRIKWNEIELNEFPSGRNLISMKERWRRLSEFCSFENEQFRINIRPYVENKAPKKTHIKTTSIQIDSMEYMTTNEVADYLRVTAATVRNMILSNRIKAFRLPGSNEKYSTYRIHKSEVQKILS